MERASRSSRRRLTDPPRGATDELPRWSADGRWILFVRSGPTKEDASTAGRLYLVAASGDELVGPVIRLAGGNYYGHYSWAEETDWYRPRVG